jgi:hypothetical protein
LLQRNPLRRFGGVLLIDALLIFTGFGLFMGAVAVGFFAFECYWSWREMTPVARFLPLLALIIAATLLGSFFVHYRWAPAVDCAVWPSYRLWTYPWFMAIMFFRPFFTTQRLVSITLVGSALLIGAILVLIFHMRSLIKRGPAPAPLVGAALLSYSLLYSANAALGRACLGMNQALGSRYVTLMIPGFLGLYLYLADPQLLSSWAITIQRNARLTASAGMRSTILAVFVVALLAGAVANKNYRDARVFVKGKRNWVECYRTLGNIHACDQAADFKIYPFPERTGLQQKLDFLKERRLNLFGDFEKHPTGPQTVPVQ